MSANRFEYVDVCPTCQEAGAKNPDTDKLFNLGFDIDEGQICCANGHVFEELPTVPVVPVSNTGPLLESSQVGETALRTSATSAQTSAENEVNSGAENGVSGPSDSHSLGDELEPESVSYGQLDSDRLASISRALEPQEIDLSGLRVNTLTEAGKPEWGIPSVVQLRQPETGCEQTLVAQGREVTLPNGDRLFGIVVPERWVQAIVAEAENQGQTPSAYLAEWFERALESEWVSSYTQTVAGSPR